MRLFPVWPKDQPARFARLRTSGAFLVSSTFRDGEVKSLRIESERGRECLLANPWPGRTVTLQRKDKPAETLTGDLLRFVTAAGEVMELNP